METKVVLPFIMWALLVRVSECNAISAWKRDTFRDLFERVPNMELLSDDSPSKQVAGLEECATQCSAETEFDCKSFDYVTDTKMCILHRHGEGDPAETGVYAQNFYHVLMTADEVIMIPNTRLHSVGNAYKNRTHYNTTLLDCESFCANEEDFRCLSLDINEKTGTCVTHSASMRQPTERLVAKEGTDHFKTAYRRLFRQLPFHSLNVVYDAEDSNVPTLEECARRCVLQMAFKCRSFVYDTVLNGCAQSQHSSHTKAGAKRLGIHGKDLGYYERNPDGPLASFINYGIGALGRQDQAFHYFHDLHKVESLDRCSQICLQEPMEDCASFDYQPDTWNCYLSKYVAAATKGLEIFLSVKTIHFERIGESLSYFYPTPYAIIPGNNHRTFQGVSPEGCAKRCIIEEGFVCRSFDYKIVDATCLLSTKTGSDVGGLHKQWAAQIHHFEMKPILNCGGKLTGNRGNFASPNWPRDYQSNLNCTWTINVPTNKIVNLTFIHLNLVSKSSCKQNGDRLEITEIVDTDVLQNLPPECIESGTKFWTSVGNSISVNFVSDYVLSAQGFRVLYSSEWPCKGVVLKEEGGEFASPDWPRKYPSNTKCDYLIVAPSNNVIRLNFTHFDLESGSLKGRCTELDDNVVIRDGENVSSSLIGRYCDSLSSPLIVDSTGNFLHIGFYSGVQVQRTGFHATYQFLPKTGGVPEIATKLLSSGAATAVPTPSVSNNTDQSVHLKDENNLTSTIPSPPIITTVSQGNVTDNSTIDAPSDDILDYIVRKNTSLAIAIVLLVVVLTALAFAAVVLIRRTNRSSKQSETGYLLHDNASSAGRDSVDMKDAPETESHYESIDEHVLFISATGAIQNPTYDRPSPEPGYLQPAVVS